MQIQNPNLNAALSWQGHTHAISNFGRSQASQALQAMRTLSQMPWISDCSDATLSISFEFQSVPHCGCLCAPEMEYAGAPAGKGLSKDPEGFPKGSVRTAGGYTIVPEQGANAWDIYGPGKELKDGAVTRVWGDPHVNEGDGTRWDFTKNSNFRLPDGTLIGVQTTSQQGASVTKSLDIINGADRVSISGIDMNRPETSEIRHDGYQFRNELATSAPERDTFVLGGDEKRIHWFQERNGVNQGLVTGSRVNAQGNWEQTLDETKDYAVDSSLRPAVGSPAWGNELRAGLADTIAESTLPQELKDLFATFVGHDHEQAARMEEARGSWSTGRIGGLTDGFDSLDEVIAAIGSLGRELLAHAHLSSGLRPRGLVA